MVGGMIGKLGEVEPGFASAGGIGGTGTGVIGTKGAG
jgi:hypothetical protein